MKVGTDVRFRTHAKVNLFLRVLGLRGDGYHEVETILQVIDLADEFVITPSSEPDLSLDIRFAPGRIGELPPQQENLIMRAAEILTERLATPSGVRIEVVKGIPVAAGLGGGSGNAAGALVVLSEMWGLDIERAEILKLAAKVGSDVPYCIDGGTALATERGEKITPLPSPVTEMWFVLGGMNYPLATGDVYAAWDRLDADAEGPHSASLAMAIGAGDLQEIASLLHNDLEPAAFSLRPELEARKEEMGRAGALGAAMTGSGPTMFGIAETEQHARAIAARIEDRFDWVEVTPSRSTCIDRL